MSWKPSKRQAQLKKRLLDSSQVYWSTSHKLDQMLLKMLHSNGIYTPDDFYNRYINQSHVYNQVKSIRPAKFDQLMSNSGQRTTQAINQTLMNLNQVLIQLKNVISDMGESSK